ncbi:hypothetical protein [Hoeflea sp.]|uniref:hypothetical protein n=1 Tax=Hoeflea sp. TaxID=1940281 RepID=UPI00374A6396
MTDLTRIFIPGPSDEANARLFADALTEGSDAAQRAAREDASQLADMMARFTEISPRLWAEIQGDMRRLIDEARLLRGYADMADLTREGYGTGAIELYLACQNPESGAQRTGNAA